MIVPPAHAGRVERPTSGLQRETSAIERRDASIAQRLQWHLNADGHAPRKRFEEIGKRKFAATRQCALVQYVVRVLLRSLSERPVAKLRGAYPLGVYPRKIRRRAARVCQMTRIHLDGGVGPVRALQKLDCSLQTADLRYGRKLEQHQQPSLLGHL